VKASANKRKDDKKVVRKETRAYEEKLQLEVNMDREEHGKKPFPLKKFEKEEWKEIKESTTDPESGYYVKDERTKQRAYSFHAGDAYFCCHEFKETSYLDVADSLREPLCSKSMLDTAMIYLILKMKEKEK